MPRVYQKANKVIQWVDNDRHVRNEFTMVIYQPPKKVYSSVTFCVSENSWMAALCATNGEFHADPPQTRKLK